MYAPPPANLQRRGAQQQQVTTGTGTTTVVAGAANATGLIVRTISIIVGAGQQAEVQFNGMTVFATQSGTPNYSGPGMLLPAGQALAVAIIGGGNVFLTWDVV